MRRDLRDKSEPQRLVRVINLRQQRHLESAIKSHGAREQPGAPFVRKKPEPAAGVAQTRLIGRNPQVA